MNEPPHAPLLAGRPVGVIGTGQMGGAIVRGFAQAHLADLRVHDQDATRMESLPATAVASAVLLARECETLFVAVKPWQVETLLRELPEFPRVLVSVAAGVTLSQLRAWAPGAELVVRAMPNTPVAIGAGCLGLCFEAGSDPADCDEVHRLCALLGEVTRLTRESEMHAYTALAGSGPAFIHTLLDALADAAVAEGMPRPAARRIAAAMTSGSARLALAEQGRLPAACLRDAVASPSGTTIEGLLALDAAGGRSAVAAAVRAAAARSRAMEQDD